MLEGKNRINRRWTVVVAEDDYGRVGSQDNGSGTSADWVEESPGV